MKNKILVLMALLAMLPAAHAGTMDVRAEMAPNVRSTENLPTTIDAGEAPKTVRFPRKTPFAVNHPKLHRDWVWIRRKAAITLPVIQWLGSAAQIAKCFY